jgi:putative flippase GtrA
MTRALPDLRPLRARLVAFGLVGAAATATHFVVGLSIVGLGMAEPFGANVVAFLTAFAVSYIGHRRFTFRSGAAHAQALPRFFAVAAGGLALNQIIVFSWVDLLGLSYVLALVIVTSVVPTVTYLAGRFWAFSEAAQ